MLEILSLLACPVRQFMSLIGLLTATEKQVHLGRLHMRPIQWHLKNNWRVPESCKLSCCTSCSYCARAFPKERIKSRVTSLSCSNGLQIKICERCFLCHSIVLCKACNKCQNCCLKSACRGQTSELLANLAGPGCRSEGGSNPERGLHPPLSDPAQSHKVSHSHKLLWQSSQEPLPVRGITSAYRQKCGRVGSKSKISGFFQPAFLGAQTQQQVETHPRPEQTKSLPQGAKI